MASTAAISSKGGLPKYAHKQAKHDFQRCLSKGLVHM